MTLLGSAEVDFVAGTAKFRKDVATTASEFDAAGRRMEQIASRLKRSVGAITFVAAAVGFERFVQQGSKAAGISAAFTRATGDQAGALKMLRTETRGVITNMDLMAGLNRAMTLGAVESAEEYGQLAKTAQALGKALGVDATFAVESLSLGIARQSKMILDNIGLVVDVDEANQKYAKSIGTTESKLNFAQRAEAFRTAAMEAARAKIEELGGAMDDGGTAASRMKVAFANVRDEWALIVARAPVVIGVFDTITGAIVRTDSVLRTTATGFGVWFDRINRLWERMNRMEAPTFGGLFPSPGSRIPLGSVPAGNQAPPMLRRPGKPDPVTAMLLAWGGGDAAPPGTPDGGGGTGEASKTIAEIKTAAMIRRDLKLAQHHARRERLAEFESTGGNAFRGQWIGGGRDVSDPMGPRGLLPFGTALSQQAGAPDAGVLRGNDARGRVGDVLVELGEGARAATDILKGSFGPASLGVAAVFEVMRGVMEPLQPIIDVVSSLLQSVGAVLGSIFAPVLKVVATGFSYVVQAIGWFVEGIGKFIDSIVPDWISKVGKGLAEQGQALQDNAKASRKAMEEMGKGADEVGGAMSDASDAIAGATNIPSWFKINLARFNAAMPTNNLPGGAASGSGRVAHDNRITGPVTIEVHQLPGEDPEALALRVAKGLDRLRSAGRTTSFDVLFAPAGAV